MQNQIFALMIFESVSESSQHQIRIVHVRDVFTNSYWSCAFEYVSVEIPNYACKQIQSESVFESDSVSVMMLVIKTSMLIMQINNININNTILLG